MQASSVFYGAVCSLVEAAKHVQEVQCLGHY